MWVTITSGIEKTGLTSSAFDRMEYWNFPLRVYPAQPLPLMKTWKFLGVMWFAQSHNKLAAETEPERKSLVQFFHGVW